MYTNTGTGVLEVITGGENDFKLPTTAWWLGYFLEDIHRLFDVLNH